MVDETNSQVNSTTTAPADDGYEYEYIELAEGEELPEGAEYEYEYVEVPADEEEPTNPQPYVPTESVASNEAYVQPEETNNHLQEDIPQFLQNDAENVAEKVVYEPVNETQAPQGEIVEEPHFEIETPSGEWKDDDDLPKFEDLAESTPVDDLKMPDFLSEPRSDSARLDDLLDDDSPLPNINAQPEDELSDDEFEKELFGTPAPDLHLDGESENAQKMGSSLAEQNDYVANEAAGLSEEVVAEPQGIITEAVTPASEPVEEPVMTEAVAPAPEPVEEPVMHEAVAPAPEPVEEPVMHEAATPAAEPVEEPVMHEAVAPAPEPVMHEAVTPIPEPVAEPVMHEAVAPAPEPVAEPVMHEAVTPIPEPVAEPVMHEAVAQQQKVQEVPHLAQSSVREEIVSVQGKDALPQSQDYQMQSEEKTPQSVKAPQNEQVSVSGLAEENIPVITAPAAHAPVAESTPAPAFQQTEEIPVEIKVYDMSDDEYQSLCNVAFPFNKNSGFRGFQADEKVYNLVVEDIDYNLHEENEWSLIIFDDYRVRLNPNEKELVLPKGDDTVRYAKIMKSGKTKLELFNEEKYNFMAPTEDFVKIRGHYIYGNIANNSKLIVKDFVNISLGDKLGKQITFNKPVSGLLTGPKAAKLYFSDVRSVIVPSAKQMHQDEEKERSKAARWYSGSSDDKCFDFDTKSQITEFVGNDACKIIHVNVGISHYGWNITFSNGLFMSFRDLLEYQTRYGQLPDNSGVITHGQQTLKFANVEKIIIYEAAQYFTYG